MCTKSSRSIEHHRIEDEDVIYKKYDLGSMIGQGSFGTVYEIKNKETHEKFAIKVVNKDKAGKDKSIFQNEVTIMKSVEHPNLIKLEEVYESKKKLYLITELCEAGELAKWIKKYGPIEEFKSKIIMRKIVDAIYYLHKNDIVHRDLKLENILIKDYNDNAEKLDIKITDFGLSGQKATVGTDSMFEGYCGTPLYMAPEIIDNYPYSKLCDVWALGIIMYIILTSETPFTAETESKLREQIRKAELNTSSQYYKRLSPEAKDCLQRMFKVNPAHRITSGELFTHAWFLDKKLSDTEQQKTVLDLMQEMLKEQDNKPHLAKPLSDSAIMTNHNSHHVHHDHETIHGNHNSHSDSNKHHNTNGHTNNNTNPNSNNNNSNKRPKENNSRLSTVSSIKTQASSSTHHTANAIHHSTNSQPHHPIHPHSQHNIHHNYGSTNGSTTHHHTSSINSSTNTTTNHSTNQHPKTINNINYTSNKNIPVDYNLKSTKTNSNTYYKYNNNNGNNYANINNNKENNRYYKNIPFLNNSPNKNNVSTPPTTTTKLNNPSFLVGNSMATTTNANNQKKKKNNVFMQNEEIILLNNNSTNGNTTTLYSSSMYKTKNSELYKKYLNLNIDSNNNSNTNINQRLPSNESKRSNESVRTPNSTTKRTFQAKSPTRVFSGSSTQSNGAAAHAQMRSTQKNTTTTTTNINRNITNANVNSNGFLPKLRRSPALSNYSNSSSNINTPFKASPLLKQQH